MGPASQESVFARQVGKGMFAQSKLATPDVLLMACAPMGPACVLMVRDNLEMQKFFSGVFFVWFPLNLLNVVKKLILFLICFFSSQN